MKRVRQSTASLVIALALTAYLLPLFVAEGRPLLNPQYRGEIRFDRTAEILLKVKSGGNRVVFQAQDVKIYCDDRETRTTIGPVSTRLRPDGTFEWDEYVLGGGSFAENDQSFRWVQGKLLGDGRARGFVFSMTDPWDPPDGANAAECSTFGERSWKAQRIG